MNKLALALSTALVTIPAMASAAHSQQQNFDTPTVVIDGTGKPVGLLMQEDLMTRRYNDQYGSRVVSISFSEQELDNNFVFFYADSACATAPFIETFFHRPVPDRALFEQATNMLWEGNPNTQITLNANSATFGSGACDPTVIATIIASPAVTIGHGFVGPFKAK